MFRKKFMISTAKKQQRLLGGLIDELEEKSPLTMEDYLFYHERTRVVVRHLKRMRRLSKAYCKDHCAQ